jgi:hypothetical protein
MIALESNQPMTLMLHDCFQGRLDDGLYGRAVRRRVRFSAPDGSSTHDVNPPAPSRGRTFGAVKVVDGLVLDVAEAIATKPGSMRRGHDHAHNRQRLSSVGG